MAEDHKPSASRDPYVFFPNNKFLESLTHIGPVMVLVIWVPIIGLFGYLSVANRFPGVFPFYIFGAWIAGIMLWTFAEYILHRFIFHYNAKSKFGQKVAFLFHGVHHMQPMVKTRLVMPPLVSIPLGGLFLGIFWLIFDVLGNIPHWFYPMFGGFATGYVFYDMSHYAMHHFNLKSKFLKFIRKHHMQHHVQTPNERFGVSSPLWDYVFGTEPKDESSKSKEKVS